jgi:hypothetical protein
MCRVKVIKQKWEKHTVFIQVAVTYNGKYNIERMIQ